MINNNIIEDLAKLTTIPDKTILKLLKKEVFCICEAIKEDVLADEPVSQLDLGIGVLYIKHDNLDNILYKFIPNKYMEKAINDTLLNKQNLLEDVLNQSLKKKFLEAYKDLC